MKRCKVCTDLKTFDDFYRAAGTRDGYRSECKACNLKRRRLWYLDNREREIARVLAWQVEHPEMVRARMDAFRAAGKKKVSDRKSRLKRKYGLTLEDFDEMLASQGGGCAICGKPDPDNVDHDHVTGRVRGILCWNCNIAIGQLEDDSDRARAMAEYLHTDDELGALAVDRVVALSS